MLSERSQGNEYILYDSIYIIQSSKTVTADQWLSEGRGNKMEIQNLFVLGMQFSSSQQQHWYGERLAQEKGSHI